MIEGYLGYRVLPTWEVEEYHSFEARPYRPEDYNLSATDVRGRSTGIKLDWGYFISGGIEVLTLLDDGLAIAWSDEDGDTQDETGTVTLAMAVEPDLDTVEAFYPLKNGAQAWRIQPIVATWAAGVLTVTFKRELAVLESLIETAVPRGVDYTNDANFLATVDLYLRANDPSQHVTFQWEAGGRGCGALSCPSCGFNTQTGCIRARDDDRLSFVSMHPASWDVDTEQFDAVSWAVGREPDSARVWYRAGYRDRRLPANEMDRELAYSVAILAASLLDRKVCDCKGIDEGIAKWQQDLAFAGGATQLAKSVMTDEVKACPFGTRAGAVEAWRRLNRSGGQKARIGRAILA